MYNPNFIRFDYKNKIIDLDETIHEFRTEFIKNKTHKNTYIVIYAKYSSQLGKKITFDGEKFSQTKHLISSSERKNIDLGYDDKKRLLKKKIKKTIIDLSQYKKIILLYPTPVSPEHIFRRVLNMKKKKNILINPDFAKFKKNPNIYLSDKINYPVEVYREFFSEEISLFDSINSKNIYKIKMEKTFCPENQCLFYDKKNIYIYDTHHPSYEGSKKINNLIMREINKSLDNSYSK